VLDEEMKKLEEQVATLLTLCQRLRQENTELRAGEKQLNADFARLAEKNRAARTRIEGIIGKLRSLEQN